MRSRGNLIFVDDRDAIYLLNYMLHTKRVAAGDEDADVRYRAWQSTVCQECGCSGEALLNGPPHVLDEDGHVLICCEGYHQINPNALGIQDEQWMDWHEELGGLADDR